MALFFNFCVCMMLTVSAVLADTSYTPAPANGGPYPPSGVAAGAGTSSATATPSKPLGQFIAIPVPPVRQEISPNYQPSQSPKKFYAVPPSTPASSTEFSTESSGTSPKPEPESENVNVFVGQQQQQTTIPDSGLYYVLLPDGRLQKVTYATMPYVENASKIQNEPPGNAEASGGFVTNVKYQTVEPINGPVYAYNAAPLIRIY